MGFLAIASPTLFLFPCVQAPVPSILGYYELDGNGTPAMLQKASVGDTSVGVGEGSIRAVVDPDP